MRGGPVRRRGGWNRPKGRFRRDDGVSGEGIDYTGLAFPKNESPRDRRDRLQKHEKAVKARIRKTVFRRDAACIVPEDPRWPHDGRDEWAHLEDNKRARTRGRPAEERHTTRGSCRLCQRHHEAYDAGRMRPRFLTDKGADGPIEWRVGGEVIGGGR